MDGTRGALLPLAASFRLRATQARCGGRNMSWGGEGTCQQKNSDGASLQGEMACPDCPLTKKQPKGDLQRLLELSTMSYGCTSAGWFSPLPELEVSLC